MKKAVQILLLCALTPMLGVAREETLEERKKRVVRKYLRERSEITQSDMVVPSDLPVEAAAVLESEKYKDVDDAFEAEDRMAITAPPPPRPRPAPRDTSSNWLLEDMEGETDAFGNSVNPFAAAGSMEKSDPWSAWEESSAAREAIGGDRANRRGENPYATREFVDPRGQAAAAERRQEPTGWGAASSSRTDLFGRNRAQASPDEGFNNGFRTGGARATYGATPDEGLLGDSTLRNGTPRGDAANPRPTGFGNQRSLQPYESPYATEREDRARAWGDALDRREQKPSYQKPNSYQQWKERNKGWDPTSDDAYLREMMPSGGSR